MGTSRGRSLLGSTEGSAKEYGLVAVLVAAAGVGGLGTLGGAFDDTVHEDVRGGRPTSQAGATVVAAPAEGDPTTTIGGIPEFSETDERLDGRRRASERRVEEAKRCGTFNLVCRAKELAGDAVDLGKRVASRAYELGSDALQFVADLPGGRSVLGLLEGALGLGGNLIDRFAHGLMTYLALSTAPFLDFVGADGWAEKIAEWYQVATGRDLPGFGRPEPEEGWWNPEKYDPRKDHTPKAEDLAAKPDGANRYLSYNTANGARYALYRSEEGRQRMADVIGASDADVVALQEVDHENHRSGHVNTAVDIVRRFNPAFEAFSDPDRFVEVGPGKSCPAVTAARACKQTLEDGTVLYRTVAGTVVFGPAGAALQCREVTGSCAGGLLRSLVNPDEGPEALAGNAAYLAPGTELEEAYTLMLPRDNPRGAPLPHELTAEERTRRDEELRTNGRGRGILVTKVTDAQGRPKTVMSVHLSTNARQREAELIYLARVAAHAHAQGENLVVMGDFNGSAVSVKKVLGKAGLELAGGNGASGSARVEGRNDIDQVWVSNGAAHDGGVVSTEGGSDHHLAPVATVGS